MENPESNILIFPSEDDILSIYDEEKLILDVTTTPFEKVLKILAGMKKFLMSLGKIALKSDVKLTDFLNHCSTENLFEVTEELNWVIKRIQSHNLYTYEVYDEDELETLKKDNLEMQSFLEMLSDYSEANEFKRRNKMPKSRTHKHHEKPFLIRQDLTKNFDSTENPSSVKKQQRENMLNIMSQEMIKIDQIGTETRRANQTGNARNPIQYKEEEKEGKKELKKIVKMDSKNLVEAEKQNLQESVNDVTKDSDKIKDINADLGGAKKDSKTNLGIISRERSSQKKLLQILNEEDIGKNKISITNKDSLFTNADRIAYEIKENTTQVKKDDKNSQVPLITLIRVEDEPDTPTIKINEGLPKISINTDSASLNQEITTLSWDTTKYSMYDPKAILSRDFNIHEFSKNVGKNNTLPFIGKTIFTAFDLTYLIDITKLDSFLDSISKGYHDVPYHNSVHGADITQTLANWIFESNLEEAVSLTDYELIAVLSACLAHDIGHPGTNNGFQVNSYSEFAITYNDQSVLENYHCSFFFKLSRNPVNNIYSKFTDAEYKQFRKRIIECIIATDMVFHAKIVSQLKGKIMIYKESLKDLPETKEKIPLIAKDSTSLFDEQQSVLNFMIHTSDIAHNSKKFKISQKWTDYLMEEFWQQGDREKRLGLPISFLCDRTTADVPKGQIGFFKAIIIPTFDTLVELLPDLNYVKEEIEKNYEEWGKIIDENKPATLFAKSPRLLKSPYMPGRLNLNRQGTASSVFGSLLGVGTKKLK